MMNRDDEYSQNEYIVIFIKYYAISLGSLMGYDFLNNYLEGNNNSSGNSSNSEKNVMFGGSNVVNSSVNSGINSNTNNSNSGTNQSTFRPIVNNQIPKTNIAPANYESFKTGRPTF